jgi:hypothetical protein
MTKQIVTEWMLASIAAQQMREQPGCQTTKSVEIDITSLDWTLGEIIADGKNPTDIARGRIVVQRDMKLKYELGRSNGTDGLWPSRPPVDEGSQLRLTAIVDRRAQT